MKQFLLFFYFLIAVISVFSQSNIVNTVTLEICNITANGGPVYVSVSSSEAAYKKRMPDQSFQFESSGDFLRKEITIPAGECVINVYQDRNGNGICDTNFFGIPKEPVGITNWNGKGPPGNYNKLKVVINNTTPIIKINLYQL